MDLATENRIAAILMKEAAEMRRQAEQAGVLAHLKRPSVRVRPNSRFLASTVLGVEQANRAVEINEMWRVREKELELENRSKGRLRDYNEHVSRHGGSSTSRSHKHDNSSNRHSDVPSLSSRDKDGDRVRPDDAGLRNDEGLQDDGGLRDDEVELFLRSRVKRGRGSIGSRMDETGPFISQSSEFHDDRVETSDYAGVERWGRTTLGPERPSRKSKESSDDDESDEDHSRRKRSKKTCSKKSHSKKHSSKEKGRDKKKRRHEKRHK